MNIPEEIDFKVVVNQLLNKLYPEYIARVTGMSERTVIAAKTGIEPRHRDGERLIACWCECFKAERKDLPTKTIGSSFNLFLS